MQKWEYLTVSATLRYVYEEWNWYASWVGNEQVKDVEQKILFRQRLNLLGQEGWELVSELVEPGNQQFDYYYYYISRKMKPFTADGIKYSYDNWFDYLGYLGKNQWELINAYFNTDTGIFGSPEGLLIFKRLGETRVRRLSFKRALE